jgi:hypothetical protein
MFTFCNWLLNKYTKKVISKNEAGKVKWPKSSRVAVMPGNEKSNHRNGKETRGHQLRLFP